MVNERVGRLAPAQRLAQMARLPAGLLAGALSQAADPRRLLQPVTGRRLAAVAAVQPETALQLGNARILRQQQGDQRVLRQLVERSAIHQLLGINPPKPCQPSSALGSAEGNLGSYLLNKHAWLFRDGWVEESADEIEDLEKSDFREREERIKNLRTGAFREILVQRGLSVFWSFLNAGKLHG